MCFSHSCGKGKEIFLENIASINPTIRKMPSCHFLISFNLKTQQKLQLHICGQSHNLSTSKVMKTCLMSSIIYTKPASMTCHTTFQVKHVNI